MRKYLLIILNILFVSLQASTYKDAGVDIDKAQTLVEMIKPVVKDTARVGSDAEIGGFGGVFDLAKINSKDPLLVSTTDGVGTKLELAQKMNKHDTIGIDLVAMCVNDLLAQGAEPLFFVDYYATGQLSLDEGVQIITGIAEGCKQSNCALTGGETAEMPGIYKQGEYDIAGFAVGVVERNQLLPKLDEIQAGDVVIQIASSGLHSNGFSLVRKIIRDNNLSLEDPAPFLTIHSTLGEALLEPTKIYVNAVLPLCKENKIKAIAHITGGGIIENIPRVMPTHLKVNLDMEQWHVPPVFQWIKEMGSIEDCEMARTFNLGIGMVLIASSVHADSIIDHLREGGDTASIIGSVELNADHSDPVEITGELKSYKMHAMVIGSGGREHALAWKLAQSPYIDTVAVAPGNGGTFCEPNMINVPIDVTDTNALISYAHENGIDLTIVGPEGPLVAGIVDAFKSEGLRCFGPKQEATIIEASKGFAKKLMTRHNIPTADYKIFTEVSKAEKYIKNHPLPVVIKADGLAAGKGVIIAHSHQEAIDVVRDMLSGASFGDAGRKIIVEEFIEGEEVSFIVVTDDTHIIPLATSQDYKKRDNGDKGPNTGGMGAYSPVPMMTPELQERIMKKIIEPTVQAMKEEGRPFTGFLYAGLMIDKDGNPWVLEFNCRLGDPETQPMMMRLKSDFFALCDAAVDKKLNAVSLQWDERPAVSVVLTAGGYPLKYRKGDEIEGVSEKDDGISKVFHAGTVYENEKLVTNGGRVLSATSLGDNFAEARVNAYHLARQIYWPDIYYRNDIGN